MSEVMGNEIVLPELEVTADDRAAAKRDSGFEKRPKWQMLKRLKCRERQLRTALLERDALQARLDAILSHNPNAEPRIREWTEADERAAYPERFGLPHHGSKEEK